MTETKGQNASSRQTGEDELAEETDSTEKTEEAPKEDYVSDQLALKTWSVVARHLHEGGGIVTLVKAWDKQNEGFLIFPSYSGQDPDAIKPDIWMAWRHVLKAPLGGHTHIRDYAEVTDALPIASEGALAAIDAEHGFAMEEARRRFREGEPGLVALVLRVYHLPRAYKFYDVAEKEGPGEFAPLPFDVALEDLEPVVADDAEFEFRRSRIRRVLGQS